MHLPKDFVSKYEKLLGADASAFLASFDSEVEKGFRLNPLKQNYQNTSYSSNEKVSYIPTGYYGVVKGNTLEHQTGYVYSQDLSAMYVAQVANVKHGEWVLDLCAAPGGKSTQLVENMYNEGLLVSNEINHKRATILAENMERTGAHNYIVLNEDPATLAHNFDAIFDKIIVDAPCSGEGMFRKDHQATSYWHQDYAVECAKRQKTILVEAMKMLKLGGELIYSTCTFAPEEDEQIIAWLLEEYPYLQVLPIKKYSGMDNGRPDWANGGASLINTVRLMPHHFRGEGHFIALLKDTRQENENVSKLSSVKKKKKRSKKRTVSLTKEQLILWQEFNQNMMKKFTILPEDLYLSGDYLYYYNRNWPDISQMKFMRPGLMLGIFKKKRFEPSYTLALALHPSETNNVLQLSMAQWQEYVLGNVIQLDEQIPNGWYLLVCEEKAFGFGKVVNKTVKNFFPKGLRFNAGNKI
ncbi:RsmF rRNA methyltransferase first C-terminal domain-containing protein [Ligilactobacillus sp. WILCCON 0076]|uniref:RsmF rRNA methyltransferase first C-terminal domain-containing protein n=1 Tax=Ligilactobacillus ubinensis TaxID=2876789 RepID=A0A9X2JP56_9LACO|nr:RsmB/NOP family class I SAM-dependent RNA methyltransferase [Ligilactobacillus ubinensis]MCP0887716.1 RsmF rRNA methyltransferase first C-terminal domain-containing protein [Ligilactobacillus ubinensis]